MVEVVIFIPGIMGSQLYQGDELVWPGSPLELLMPYSKMAQLLNPELRVGDIIRNVSLSNQYASLVVAFGLCGFEETVQKATLAVCPYDWRKDNALAATLLGSKIRNMRELHGEDVSISLVAHSMGGLIARYLLESGLYTEENCPGFANVRRLITIGTPHRGAPLALCAVLGQVKRLFLSAVQVKQLAEKKEFPSLYQLMPPANEPFLWNVDPESRLSPINPYDPEISKRLGLSQLNIESAVAFHSAINPNNKPDGVSYFCFSGTRQETIANVQVTIPREHLNQAFGMQTYTVRGHEISDGGDGTVPGWSSSFPAMQQLAVGGDHGSLYKAADVLKTLGSLLGKQGVLSSEINPSLVRLSNRDDVVTPQSTLYLVLFLNTPTDTFTAEIVVRKLADSKGKELAAPVVVATIPVSYSGARIDSLSLVLSAPEYAGVYEIDLYCSGSSRAENRPVLLVQNG